MARPKPTGSCHRCETPVSGRALYCPVCNRATDAAGRRRRRKQLRDAKPPDTCRYCGIALPRPATGRYQFCNAVACRDKAVAANRAVTYENLKAKRQQSRAARPPKSAAPPKVKPAKPVKAAPAPKPRPVKVAVPPAPRVVKPVPPKPKREPKPLTSTVKPPRVSVVELAWATGDEATAARRFAELMTRYGVG